MLFVRGVVCVVVMVLLGACADKTVVKEHPVVEIPDGRKTKSIRLGKIVNKVPRGHVVGQTKIGFLCWPVSSITRTSQRSVNDAEFSSIFFDELKRNNYNVVGDPDDLFAKGAPATDLVVSGLITYMTMDVCYTNASEYYMNYQYGKASSTLKVEWQVYSNMTKKVLFKSTSDGQAEKSFSDGNAEDVMYLAFSSAVQGLLADKRFYETLIEPEKSTGNFGGLSDSAVPSGQSMAANGSMSGMNGAEPGNIVVAAHSNEKRSLDDVKKSVVVLQLGAHGSGFLLGDEGYIMTNQHVVEGATRMRVVYQDGVVVEGTVIKSDEQRDVAIVKIDNPRYKGLPLRLDEPSTGTEVFAVGAPLGTDLQGTVTKGIVSGYRELRGERWLQSDATINGGNSGGPLVDSQGRVTALSCLKRIGGEGIAFFVPLTDGLRVLGVQVK